MNETNNKTGETDLGKILRSLQPELNAGEFVFCNVQNLERINLLQVVHFFREKEGYTVVLEKNLADRERMPYSYVAAWITLTAHTSLEAVGLTAVLTTALADNNVSCNVVAATFHDHIFVDAGNADKAMNILAGLSKRN
jgi:hypothetical protein